MESAQHIEVSICKQQLTLFQGDRVVARLPVSTAKNGCGELIDSGCTPRGKHSVRVVIGRGCAEGAVFIGRRFTGEIYSEETAQQNPEKDWILSRIIWLTGKESGFNRGGNCDTLRRFIYIHGTPDSEPMGEPVSHGCIRMRNSDVIDIADRIRPGTVVRILE